ncbi:hypothetical protein C2W59_01152 [Bacillus pumilus]|uniref:PmeII family type II restriction endonuclease n=1 Tax=Bacillus pumilus TaxID=1408 RepID=UPI000DC3C141|nr:PmeII family type II restriction endonuclease [Bacillus pumilus]RAP19368.1 hypothetical protein C2W59_01152 [Bacillus pumilus]
MDNVDLEKLVDELLNNFYQRRIEKINKLKLKDALSRKNPYLYKATGYEDASEIVKEILSAFMSSSDEGIFGDAFFEPLAEAVSGGSVSDAEGVDVTKDLPDVYQAIAVKSGTNVFNADSRKKQLENFRKLKQRVVKRHKRFEAIIGYGYGKKYNISQIYDIIEMAGQVFWEELTGDAEFFIKIVDLMKDKPQKHLPEYQKSFDAAVNRFTRDFIDEFCCEDGTIDWKKLLVFNSGKPCKKLVINPKGNKALDKHEDFQIEVTVVFADDEEVNITGEESISYDNTKPKILTVTETGLVRFNSEAEPGDEAKIAISCFGKTATRTFKLKKSKKKKSNDGLGEQKSLF